jgi:hypothetical protein
MPQRHLLAERVRAALDWALQLEVGKVLKAIAVWVVKSVAMVKRAPTERTIVTKKTGATAVKVARAAATVRGIAAIAMATATVRAINKQVGIPAELLLRRIEPRTPS